MKITPILLTGNVPKDSAIARLTEGDETRVVEKSDGRLEIKIGAGKLSEMTRRKLIIAARRAVALAKENKAKKLAVYLEDFLLKHLNLDKDDTAELLAQNFELANYEFVKYKSRPKSGWDTVTEMFLIGTEDPVIKRALRRGQIIGRQINECRDLANTPGGEMTPGLLAEKAKEAAADTAIKITILNKKDMQEIGMGGVLGVGQGSANEPKFIILEYKGGKVEDKPIVLVGKGVTFDTGGLNLKPEQSIYEMHMDMSGAAAAIHATILAAKLNIKRNIVALAPAVENMPSGSSYRPGDILKTLSGKTIEVANTDAEGRIILADALAYAERYNPALVVDVATLTGASLIALGQVACAIMTPDKNFENLFQKLGEESGDYVWPFPLWDEYAENIKGQFGDVANVPLEGNSRYAGVINGGMFLYQFAKKYPWVHIDMAPRMTSVKGEYLAKGAAGAPIRLLLKVIENF